MDIDLMVLRCPSTEKAWWMGKWMGRHGEVVVDGEVTAVCGGRRGRRGRGEGMADEIFFLFARCGRARQSCRG
jgi:hypothetical protein